MTWVHVLPALILAAVLLTVPGLLVGLALGLRREASIGAAPLLSVTALALGATLSTRLHLTWGLLPVALATVVLGVLCGAVFLVSRRIRPSLVRVDDDARERTWWGDTAVFVGSILVGALWVAAISIHTIGDVNSVNQTFDGVFHVNAIQRVAELGSASPSTVGATSNTTGKAIFYPPLFHGIAGLLVAVTGVSAVVAANVLAVVIAAGAWVISLAMLGHVVLARHRFGILATVVAAAAIPLFPYLLMAFGVLWPNLLSVSVLPAALGFVVVVLGQAKTRTMPWVSALVGGLISVYGLYFAHPNAVFAAVALSLPVVVTALVQVLSHVWRTRRFGPLWAVIAAVVIWQLGRAAWVAVLAVPQLKSTMKFNWPAVMSMAQGLGTALSLGSPLSPSSWLLAALLVLGAVHAMRSRHTSWLVVAHGLVVYLYMLAAGSDEEISQQLTGFWYNDQFRLAALLPITGAPLIAIGLVWARDRIVDAFAAWHDQRPARDDRHLITSPRTSVAWQWAIGAVVLALVVLCVPGGPRLKDVALTLKNSYYPTKPYRTLVDHAEGQLYIKALKPAGPQDKATVIGNPWTGGALAGPMAGRTSVYGHMVNVMDPDRKLLTERFRDLGTSREVCAAVHRLNIGYATEDLRKFWADDGPRRPWTYPGVDNLAGRPGLTPIAHEDTVTVYRVSCRP